MKILHTISGLDILSGGPSQSVYSLVSGTRNSNYEIDIVTFSKNKSVKNMIANEPYIHILNTSNIPRFGYSSSLCEFYNLHPYDIYYCNGLWQYPIIVAANYARKTNKPYVLVPHGMLYPEALKKSKWLKKIALVLYQKYTIKNATCIHATCAQEMVHIRNLGYTNPIAIIPNPTNINIPPYFFPIKKIKKQVGFIGRFVPIKNIDFLIKAWSIVGKNLIDWELVLIGDGERSYKESLVNIINQFEIKNIQLKGFLHGEVKEQAIGSLDYLVLPSKSENFGMVVPEALLREIPVIASKGTPWEELNTCNAGWWIDIGVEPLAEALKQALQLSETERKQMGRNGRKLVEENYSMESVGQKMIKVYEWILNDGEKPEFVYLTK